MRSSVGVAKIMSTSFCVSYETEISSARMSGEGEQSVKPGPLTYLPRQVT